VMTWSRWRISISLATRFAGPDPLHADTNLPSLGTPCK
jgi:hypothetical protein